MENQLHRPRTENEGMNTERMVPIMKKHFTRLKVEPSSSPFFTRVWYIRHRLDSGSPLLKTHVKERIVANDGKWPHELNDYSEIRNALLPFRRIVSSYFCLTDDLSLFRIYLVYFSRYKFILCGIEKGSNVFRYFDCDDGAGLCIHIL